MPLESHGSGPSDFSELLTPKRPVKLFAQFVFSYPNEHHQSDLVFMPSDRGHKFMLTVIDGYSRYAIGVPLKDKKAQTINTALKLIWKKDKWLSCPTVYQTDSGTEFKQVKSILGKTSKHVTTQVGDHRAQSLIERFHRTIEAPLMNSQVYKDLQRIEKEVTSKEVRLKRDLTEEEFDKIWSASMSRVWVSGLDKALTDYNNRKHSTIGATPLEVISRVKQPKTREPVQKETNPNNIFRVGDIVRVANDVPDRGWRVGDIRFSYNKYIVRRITPQSDRTPFVYYLVDEKNYDPVEKGFYGAELKFVA